MFMYSTCLSSFLVVGFAPGAVGASHRALTLIVVVAVAHSHGPPQAPLQVWALMDDVGRVRAPIEPRPDRNGVQSHADDRAVGPAFALQAVVCRVARAAFKVEPRGLGGCARGG